MSTLDARKGFSVVEIVIILAVVGIIGALGYTVYKNQTAKNSTADQTTSQAATASDVKSTPAIKSTADLDTAAATLDQTDPNGSDTSDASQLDTQLSDF